MRDSHLTRRILRHVRNECTPDTSCVRFDTATPLGSHEPETVLHRVRQLREEGLLEVIDVETSDDGRDVAIAVRGLTPEGEDLLQES